MAAQLTVIAGPPGSGKTDRLLVRYREVLGENKPGPAVWLAPTWRAAAEIRGRLFDGVFDGCFSPGVMTFEKFAEAVLEAAPVAIRPMSRLMKRHLVRRLIEQQLAADRLKHFGSIARTGGLVDLVCDFISELKRLEIWPEEFRRACTARGITDKDVELLEIYDAYQRCLSEHDLYDAEGRFWSARDLLGKEQSPTESPPTRQSPPTKQSPPRAWRPLEHLRLVVADGFTDFTRTQHEILEILAGRVEELLITLPLEAEPRRSDLFTKPLKTLSELRRRHPQLVLEELPRPQRPDWPAMAHLEKTLFTNPRRPQPTKDTAGLEILAAARQMGEIELIGSRIKRLLTEDDARAGGRPVRPGEIAVVFRWAQDAGDLVAEVFGSLGIPFALETGQPLDRSPALGALAAVFRLEVEDWPFRDLLAVLGSNYFQPDWPEWLEGKAAVAAERAIRRLQLPRGRERLLERLQSGESEPTKPRPVAAPAGRDHRSRLYAGRATDAPAVALLLRLAAALDELPQRATLADWAKAWERLADQTGLLRAIEQDAPSGPRAGLPDRLAWRRLQEALAAGDTLAGWLGQHPLKLDRREALAALLDTLASEQVGPGGDESGRVRVLSAASVRALRIPYLFLAGLSERAFPPPEREDRLYSEADSQRLIDTGLPLVARSERNREEMLLFYEAMTRATRRLYLSYPALDESAQPLLPSPYLKEVERSCGPGRIRRTELTDLSPVPADDEPLSAATFRIKAVSTALEGNVSLLAGLLGREPAPGLAENVLAGLRLTRLRRDREGFSPAEGMLSGQAVQKKLSARFALQQTFSATELELYASCPYRFFLERVLKLEPIEDLVLAVDFLQRGRLAHEVLAAFHRRVNQARGRPTSPAQLDSEEYDRLLAEAFEESFPAQLTDPLQAALREVDRRLLLRWTDDYREQHERYDKLWQECEAPLLPELFEVSFGKTGGGEGPPSTDPPLEFSAAGRTIRISGRIDRIDTGRVAGRPVFNVLDYKTGGSVRFSPEAVAAGTALQLPLYAIAAAELLLGDRDAIPWVAGYWYLRDKGFKQAVKTYKRTGGGLVPEDQWEQIRIGLAETVANLVRGIRRGEFPVCSADERCTGYCPYHTICRINQVRSLEKTWQPAANKA